MLVSAILPSNYWMWLKLISFSFSFQVACDDLRTIIKDKEVEALRSIHVDALRSEMELIY